MTLPKSAIWFFVNVGVFFANVSLRRVSGEDYVSFGEKGLLFLSFP